MDASQFAELEAKVKSLETENAALKQAGESASNQATQMAERLAAVERERQAERFQSLIKNDGARWFGETAELLTELAQFAKVFGEQSPEFAAYVKRQNAAAAVLRASAALNELGGDGQGKGEDAAAKLNRLAGERAKAEGISYTDALGKVAAENPGLYQQHSNAAYVRTKGAE